jgi:hypothetical protein
MPAESDLCGRENGHFAVRKDRLNAGNGLVEPSARMSFPGRLRSSAAQCRIRGNDVRSRASVCARMRIARRVSPRENAGRAGDKFSAWWDAPGRNAVQQAAKFRFFTSASKTRRTVLRSADHRCSRHLFVLARDGIFRLCQIEGDRAVFEDDCAGGLALRTLAACVLGPLHSRWNYR